jgi:hypothetical protein
MGDSKVVIKWLIDKGRLQVSSVEGWKARINSLAKNFQSISFHHRYKNFNFDTDVLSKRAIGEPEGVVCYYIWTNGVEGPTRQIKIH